MNWKQFVLRLHAEESGQDLLEYALVLATVLVAIVAGSDSVASVLSNALSSLLGKVDNTVQ